MNFLRWRFIDPSAHSWDDFALREILKRATGLLSERFIRLRPGIVESAKSACFITAHLEDLD